MARDPYQELGVSRGASADEVRKAFRKLAKAHHPDTNPNNKVSEERFKQVTAAFDILGRGRGGGGPTGGFGGGGFQSRGSDVKARLEVELDDVIHGGKKRISFSDGRTIDVTIPKGAEEGQTLRLKGQGAPGRAGPGDALIEIAIRPHPIYRREGDSLVMDLPVSIPDAVLGGKVQAPTPDGPVMVTVPKGANLGQSLRLKGRGLSDSRGKRGDLIARLAPMLPDTPDPELEAFAEKWRKERPYKPKKK